MTSADEFADSGNWAGFPAERWQQVWSHREHLLKVARRRSVSREDAEDAVHEAMLRAAERTDIDSDRIGAWLTTVTVRLCVDRHRQLNRTDMLTPLVKTASGEMGVEEVLCAQAEATWLAERCQDLPARQAEALNLQAQDLDLSQIARRMGLSYRAVQSLLARGRKTLRATLAGTFAVAVWSWRGGPRAALSAQPVTAVSAAVTLAVAGLNLPAVSETQQAPPIGLDAHVAAPPTPPHRPLKSPATPHEPAASRTAADTGAGLFSSARHQLSGQLWSAAPQLSATGPADLPGLLETTLPAAPELPDTAPQVSATGPADLPGLPETTLPAAPELPDTVRQALPVPSDVPAQVVPTSPDGAPTLILPSILATPDAPLLQR